MLDGAGADRRATQTQRTEVRMSAVSDDTASRWTTLAEVDNVRDLGGLPVTGGGRTRRGVAYRASTLQEATAEDTAQLVEVHGIRTIVDLRLPDEAAREGHGLVGEAGLRIVNLPVRKAETTLLDVVVPDARTTDLGVLYEQLLVGSTDSLVATARLLADPAQGAVLFHCAAGKDRTGVVAAVVLDAVGVPEDAIVADYVLTEERQHEVRRRLVRIPAYRNLPPVAQGVMGVDGDAIRRFLAALHSRYGGGAEFLLRHGLEPDGLAALRSALVD
jgi:protein-tyrosine phosphatase